MKLENKKLVFKILIFTILSNLMFYILFFESPPEITLHREDYSKVLIKANLRTPFETQKEILLHDPKNDLSVSRIYLLDKVQNSNDFTMEEQGNTSYIVIDVPKTLLSFFFKKDYAFEVYPKEHHYEKGVKDVSF